MNDEMKRGNYDDAKEIIDDVIGNEEKINHHGKRADAIVKGMLQHSRSKSGVKEPTDINALADEYLRLAYHGLRAKDKSFNATMKTDYDESISNINIIPQDIGRVILNADLKSAFSVQNNQELLLWHCVFSCVFRASNCFASSIFSGISSFTSGVRKNGAGHAGPIP